MHKKSSHSRDNFRIKYVEDRGRAADTNIRIGLFIISTYKRDLSGPPLCRALSSTFATFNVAPIALAAI